jgi:hypothetical protein
MEKLHSYYATTYARSGVNKMWILKNSKELSAKVETQNFSQINSIKTYDFSNLYTTISHDKLISKPFDTINNCFFNNKWQKEIFIFSDQSSNTLLC